MTKRQLVLACALSSLACTGNMAGSSGTSPDDGPPGMGGMGGRGETPASGGARGPSPTPEALPEGAFQCDAQSIGSVPRRIWRLTQTQYQAVINAALTELGGQPDAALTPFLGTSTAGSHTGFSNSSDVVGLGFEAGQAMTVTEAIAARIVTTAAARQGSCVGSLAAGTVESCARSVLGALGATMFRRPLPPAELDVYVGLAKAAAADMPPKDAFAAAVQAMLMSPYALFRVEVGRPDGGWARLDDWEIASALSFALTNGPPDAALRASAAAGKLTDAQTLAGEVERLLGAAHDNGALRQFLREYFRYPAVRDVFKDPKKFPFHDSAALERDADAFVAGVVQESAASRDFLPRLLGSPSLYVQRKTAVTYGLTAGSLTDVPKRVDAPMGQRAGILTQPAFLAANSTSDETEPVKRGHFVSESLLCQTITSPAIGTVPELPATGTMRERLAMHSASPACAGCHKFMDRYGLALERYDHLGRYRTTQTGEAGGPVIDPSGTIEGSGNQDGAFADAIELADKLGRSEEVVRCFARHAFRFYLGWHETNLDSCALAQTIERFGENGGDLKGLFVGLLSSPSFLNRQIVD